MKIQDADIINKILDDINLESMDKEAWLILDKETEAVKDYEFDDTTEALHLDEKRVRSTLFKILVLNIIAQKNKKNGMNYCPNNATVMAFRLLENKTQEEFAKELKTPYRTYISWEVGERNTPLETVLKIYNDRNIPIDFKKMLCSFVPNEK